MAGNPYRQITLPNGQRMTVPANSAGGILANANARNSFEQSAGVPIPGLTGSVGSGAGIPGLQPMAPSQPNIPLGFQASGPYGMQAMQMAGLLGSPGMATPMQGLLGKAYRIPGVK